MIEPLIVWVVYDHPIDYQDSYVARKFIGTEPTKEVLVTSDLEVLRCDLSSMGLVHLSPSPDDEKQIIDIWL